MCQFGRAPRADPVFLFLLVCYLQLSCHISPLPVTFLVFSKAVTYLYPTVKQLIWQIVSPPCKNDQQETRWTSFKIGQSDMFMRDVARSRKFTQEIWRDIGVDGERFAEPRHPFLPHVLHRKEELGSISKLWLLSL